MKILNWLSRLLSAVILISLTIPATATAQKSQEVTLAGYKMQPKVATSGSGSVSVTLKGDTLIVEGEFKNLTNRFSGGYIMVDLQGHPGNQIHRLDAELNEEKTGGTLKAEDNSFVLTKGQKDLLKKGDLFILISTFEHQRGEIRGDIAPMN